MLSPFGWCVAAIVVLGLLPNAYVDVGPTNKKYAELAKRRGVTFLDCASRGMNPNDKTLFKDGTHPTAAGHELIMRCLKPELFLGLMYGRMA